MSLSKNNPMNSKRKTLAFAPIFLALVASVAFGQVPTKPRKTPDEKLDLIQTTLDTVKGSVVDIKKDGDEAKKALEALQKALKDFRESNAKDVEALKAQIKVATDAIERVQGTASAIQRDVAKVQTSVTGVQAEVLGVKRDVQQVGSDVKTVDSDVKAVGADVKIVESNVEDLQRNLAIANKSLEQLRTAVGENEARRTTDLIEQQLRTGKYTVSLYHPSNQGGGLDLVRQIVVARMKECEQSKANVSFANSYLESGDSALSKGKWNRALSNYGRAYRELVRASKGPWAIFPMF